MLCPVRKCHPSMTLRTEALKGNCVLFGLVRIHFLYRNAGGGLLTFCIDNMGLHPVRSCPPRSALVAGWKTRIQHEINTACPLACELCKFPHHPFLVRKHCSLGATLFPAMGVITHSLHWHGPSSTIVCTVFLNKKRTSGATARIRSPIRAQAPTQFTITPPPFTIVPS